jgi:hypothetical protein
MHSTNLIQYGRYFYQKGEGDDMEKNNFKLEQETNRLLPLKRHGPHRKRCVQQLFCFISCRGNVFTKPLPSNDGGYAYRHRLMGGIYEVRRWDGLSCHDIHTKFNRDWLRHSKVNRRYTLTHRQHGDRTDLLSFFQNKESRLKWGQGSHDHLSKLIRHGKN